jgi:DNA-binding XRE family transcriptional regulator
MIDKTLTVPERLIAARGDRTQQEVADAIGVSVSAIGMYETGMRVPRDNIKVRLAEYFRMSVQELFY